MATYATLRTLLGFTRCIALSCSNRDAAVNSLNRGVAYLDKGEYDQAIADFTEAIRLDPNDAGSPG